MSSAGTATPLVAITSPSVTPAPGLPQVTAMSGATSSRTSTPTAREGPGTATRAACSRVYPCSLSRGGRSHMPEAFQNIRSSRLFATRGGTIAVGLFAALLALLILLLYLSNYRSSIRSSSAPVPVLVAKRLIPQGTAGDVLGSSGGFEATEVPKGDVKEGALSDPAVLRGRVALADLYPGQQLTLADFTPTAVATLGARLTGKQRAMSIPIDTVHGMIGQVVPGDR